MMFQSQKHVGETGSEQHAQMIIEHGLSKQIESSRRHMNTIHSKLERIEQLLKQQMASHQPKKKWKRETLFRIPTRKRLT